MKFHYVYILESDAYPEHFYVGLTEDLRDRLRRHNGGEVPHTTKFRPWRIKTAVAFGHRDRAVAFERYLKTASGWAFAKKSYNNGSRNIEQMLEELVKLARSLNEEEQRRIREHLTEEELVIFDILTRPAPELSQEERTEVKKVTRELLTKLKQLLVINWRQKSAVRSQLKLAIEDVLDAGLPRAYTPELYQQKCSAVFEHFYENFADLGVSTFAA